MMVLWPTWFPCLGRRKPLLNKPNKAEPVLATKRAHSAPKPNEGLASLSRRRVNLPDELWLNILAQLPNDLHERVRLEGVSHQFLRVAQDNSFWRMYPTPHESDACVGIWPKTSPAACTGAEARHAFQKWVTRLNEVERKDIVHVIHLPMPKLPSWVQDFPQAEAGAWVAVCRNPHAFIYANASIKKSRALTLMAVARDGACYTAAWPQYQEDDVVALAAVQRNGWLLPALPQRLQQQKHIRQAALLSIKHNLPMDNFIRYLRAVPAMRADADVRHAMLQCDPLLCFAEG
jgi:hypothetical protein